MITLGFDTATPATAVGLRLADGTTLEARDDPPSGTRPGHTTRLLEIARELLAQAELEWHAVQRIAAGVGPGTFTGLRVGLATARGLAQALSTELVGVSSLRALAHHAPAPAALAVIDARRGEVFLAAYRVPGPGLEVELLAPRAIEPEEVPRAVATLDAGDGPSGWSAIGDGALRYRDQLETGGINVVADASPLHRVSAAAICELGASAGNPWDREELLPDYLRRPDAEIALSRSGGDGAGVPEALEGAER